MAVAYLDSKTQGPLLKRRAASDVLLARATSTPEQQYVIGPHVFTTIAMNTTTSSTTITMITTITISILITTVSNIPLHKTTRIQPSALLSPPLTPLPSLLQGVQPGKIIRHRPSWGLGLWRFMN